MTPPERPICSIDVESTGTDPAIDRVVQIGILKILPLGHQIRDHQLFNPGIPIPAKTTEIHKITDAMVEKMPRFKDVAAKLLDILTGCDLLGFNLNRFDVPIIWEEFYRAGITWNLDGVRVIDAAAIFMKKQPRTLTDALRIYAGITERIGAHDALSDAVGTWEVFVGQRSAHADIGAMTIDELHKFSKFDDKIDLAGKLVMINGKPCYGFGKLKGTPIAEDMGYADWMLQRDFSVNTKIHLRAICEKIIAEEWQERLSDQSPF